MEDNTKFEVKGIDKNEFHNQNREQILNSKKYCEFSVLVGKGNPIPSASVYAKDVTQTEMVQLFIGIRELTENLKKQFPLEFAISQSLDAFTDFIDGNKDKEEK